MGGHVSGSLAAAAGGALVLCVNACGRLADEPSSEPPAQAVTTPFCTAPFRSTLPLLSSDRELLRVVRTVEGLPPEQGATVGGGSCGWGGFSDGQWRPLERPGSDGDRTGELGRVKRMGDTLLVSLPGRVVAVSIVDTGKPRTTDSIALAESDGSSLLVQDDRAYVLTATGQDFSRSSRATASVQGLRVREGKLEKLSSLTITGLTPGTFDAQIIGEHLVLLVQSSPTQECWDGVTLKTPMLRQTSPSGVSDVRPLFGAHDVAASLEAPPSLGPGTSPPRLGNTSIFTVVRCDLTHGFDCASRAVVLPSRIERHEGSDGSAVISITPPRGVLSGLAILDDGVRVYAVRPDTLDVAAHSSPRGRVLRARSTCETLEQIRTFDEPPAGLVTRLAFADFDGRGEQATPSGLPLGALRDAVFAGRHAVTITDGMSGGVFDLATGRRSEVVLDVRPTAAPIALAALDDEHVLVNAPGGVQAPTITNVVDVAREAPIVRRVESHVGYTLFERRPWLAGVVERPLEGQAGWVRPGIELLSGSIEGFVTSGPIFGRPRLASSCIHGCPDRTPHAVFTADRAFMLVDDELHELRLDGAIVTAVGAVVFPGP